mgnify:CR=1 FL=1
MGPFTTLKSIESNSSIKRYVSSRFASYAYFVSSSSPFFARGGDYGHGIFAGQLYFGGASGEAYSYVGFRLVLTP